MTEAKKLKRTIRARAKRTGESYAVARTHVLAKVDKERARSTADAAAKARSGPSAGSVSEAKCIERTGHGFDHWFALLDAFGARNKGHTAAARYLREEHTVSPWYCQGITVAYERARGLREVNQTCAGGFEVSVSRVLPLGVSEATAGLSRKDQRARWLPDVGGQLATGLTAALASKRLRRNGDVATFRYADRDATVEWRFAAKPDGRSTVVVRTSGLANAAGVERARAEWRGALDRLRDYCRARASG